LAPHAVPNVPPRGLTEFRREYWLTSQQCLTRIGGHPSLTAHASLAYGLSMISIPKTTWLERFAARLLRLNPELSALDAVRIAQQQYAMAARLDPAEAAEIYAAGTASNERSLR